MAFLKDLALKVQSMYLYKQYRKWIDSGKDIKAISHSNYSWRKSKFSKEVLDHVGYFVDKHYLNRQCDLSIGTVYKMYEDEHIFNDEPKMSRSSFYDYVSKLDAYEVCLSKYGREVANAKYRKIAFHYIPNYPLEVVELDAVHLTLGVLDEVRQKVIGTLIIYLGIDRYTRSVLGYNFGIKTDGAGENTKDVIKLIQHIMYPKLPMPHCSNPWFSYGKPTILLLDAGPAFNNKKVKDVVNGFGATHAVTPTRTPQKKPFIERMMRTLREHFASSIPGYLDKNVRQNIPANWRELNAFLTLSEIKSLFEYWVCDHYHTHAHAGLDGMTPQAAWHQYYSQPGVIPPIIPDFNPQSFGEKHTATIQGGKGIQFKYNFYNSDELQNYYRYLKTLHNDNPKVTFYIDEDSNPEVIWVDNLHTHKFLQATCAVLRSKPKKNAESSNLTMSSNIALSNELHKSYQEKQKENKDKKQTKKKNPASPAKELSTNDISMMLKKNREEAKPVERNENEKSEFIDLENIKPIEPY